MTNTLVEQLRNPELRDSNFTHPSGNSEVIFSIQEVNINAETWTPAATVTYSSIPCIDLIGATIIIT